MAYEWKLKARPYSDDEAKTLLKNVISPETSDWHYNKHHAGYVAALNTIEKGLASADRSKANAVRPGTTPELCFMMCTGKFSAATATRTRALK